MNTINSGSVVNQALIGMQRSQAEIVTAAREVAQIATAPSSTDSSSQRSVIEPLIAMKASAVVFDSNAKVLEVGDRTLGRLLDTRA